MNRTGFSLVELMAVLAVLGTLVMIALPKFRVFIARSRQAEAINNLGVIKSLQKSYNLRWSGFGHDEVYYYGMFGGNGTQQNTCRASDLKNELGFRLEDCQKARYTYDALSGEAWSYGRAFNNGMGTLAIYPDCTGAGKDDAMYMCRLTAGCGAKAGEIYAITDVVKKCDN